MNETTALIGILATLLVGAMSPGPSCLLVARFAVSSTRSKAVHSAIGMGLGGAAFCVLALMGLNELFELTPLLFTLLKVAGGLYLCYLGVSILLASRAAETLTIGAVDEKRATGSLWLGFLTQVSNPKTAVVYASVLAAFMPSPVSLTFSAVLVALVFAVEAAWYSLVAVLLSSHGPRSAYLLHRAWFDRAAGVVMSGLGIRLLSDLE